jgi:hypothetical protein
LSRVARINLLSSSLLSKDTRSILATRDLLKLRDFLFVVKHSLIMTGDGWWAYNCLSCIFLFGCVKTAAAHAQTTIDIRQIVGSFSFLAENIEPREITDDLVTWCVLSFDDVDFVETGGPNMSRKARFRRLMQTLYKKYRTGINRYGTSEYSLYRIQCHDCIIL